MGFSGRATFFIMQLLFGIVCVVIGSLFIDQCPVQKMIPVFLVVAGVTNIVLVILACLQSFYYDEDTESDLDCWRVVIILFTLFWCGWFIAGSYWVYSNYQPDYDPKHAGKLNPDYCEKGLYLFSFWAINLTYMFFFVFLIAAFIIYVFMPDVWSQMWGY